MKKILLLFFVLLVSVPLIVPFLKSGYFPTHDGEWAVVRQGAMHRAFIDRHFPVRWAGNLNFGFGYPLFLFTYPLPYYIGEIPTLLHLGLVNSVKVTFVLSVLLSAVAMFFLGRALFGNTGGFISSVFYLYAPYRFVDLFVRGSIGESLSLGLFPLIFLTMIKLMREKSLPWVGIFAFLFGALFLTHNVMALLFTPFTLAFAAILLKTSKKEERYLIGKYLALGLLLGVLLSSFFLLPALFEKRYVILSYTPLADVTKHFVTLRQLLVPSWGFGGFGKENGFSPQLGIVYLLGFLVALFVLAKLKRSSELFQRCAFILGSCAILILLLFPISLPFWRYVPLFSHVDFPWRALGPAIFFLSLFVGLLGMRRLTSYVGMVLAVLVVLFNMQYAKPKSYFLRSDDYYLTNEATTTSSDELMPMWVKEKPKERFLTKTEVTSGKAVIRNLSYNSVRTSFVATVEEEAAVTINTVYFPGWSVVVDDKEVPIDYGNKKGLITFLVPKGTHSITASFSETPFRLASDMISLVSAGAIMVFIVYRRRSGEQS